MKPSSLSRSPRWLSRSLLLFLSSFAIPHSSFAEESPLYIPFQGQVTNQAGALTADGQYSVIFNLYDQPVGGQPIWSERHTKIGVTRGMINVFLGSISPLTSVDFSQTKYLGITVDTDNLATTPDPEMVPRSLIMPAFHAKNAEKLAGHNWSAVMTGSNPSTSFIQSSRIDANTINTNQMVNAAVTDIKLAANSVTNAKIADGSVTNSKLAANSVSTSSIQDGAVTAAKLSTDVTTPAGTIVAYIGDVAPVGWYLCNGADLPRGGLNANLEGVVGTRFGNAANPGTHFKLPDFRGMFLRGAGVHGVQKTANNANYDGGIIGAYQHDQFQAHRHKMRARIAADGAGGGSISSGDLDSQQDLFDFFGFDQDSIVSFGSFGTPRVGSETKPASYSVNYIIKY